MTRLIMDVPAGLAPMDVAALCDELADVARARTGSHADVVEAPFAISHSPEEVVALVCGLDLVLGVGDAVTDASRVMLRATRARLRESLR